MEHVIIWVSRTVKHSESWNDKPAGRLIVKDVSPYGGGEHVVGTSNLYYRRQVGRQCCPEGGIY